MIRYATYSYEENEHLYGPGKRLLLFTQGCSLRCKGCVNSHLWSPDAGTIISAEELADLCKGDDVEGITLHGGEPLDQADGILKLIKRIKAWQKTVVLFTGYTYKELSNKSQKAVWRLSDIVISGRYVEEKRNVYLQFRGSTNQRVYVHQGRYKGYHPQDGTTVAILRLDENGRMTRRGFLNDALISLIEDLKRKS